MSPKRVKVHKILNADASSIVGTEVKVQGWVRTVRDQKKFAFVEINDGSSMTGLQAVVEAQIESYGEVAKLSTGAAVEVVGVIAESQGKGQKYEIKATGVKLVGACPADTYPLQKKRHSQEFLRGIAHLRPRTNTIAAVARVRSALAFATHEHFQKEGHLFLQVHTHAPGVTASGTGLDSDLDLDINTPTPLLCSDTYPHHRARSSLRVIARAQERCSA